MPKSVDCAKNICRAADRFAGMGHIRAHAGPSYVADGTITLSKFTESDSGSCPDWDFCPSGLVVLHKFPQLSAQKIKDIFSCSLRIPFLRNYQKLRKGDSAVHLEVENIHHSQTKNMSLTICDIHHRSTHLHPELEILLILKGSPSININGISSVFAEQDVVLINANELHEIISDTEPSTVLALHILPQYFEGYFAQMTSIKFEENKLISKNKPLFIYTFCKLLQTYLGQEPYYQLQCAGFVNIMIYDILQSCAYHQMYRETLRQTTHRGQLLSAVISYVEEHYTERLTLTQVASHLNLSPSYLSHFIPEHLHHSFSEFLTYTRYLNAKALLMNTDLSLTEICYSCGFSDYRYMNKAFKKYTACTPNEFKKKTKTNSLPNSKKGIVKPYTRAEMMQRIESFLAETKLDQFDL